MWEGDGKVFRTRNATAKLFSGVWILGMHMGKGRVAVKVMVNLDRAMDEAADCLKI